MKIVVILAAASAVIASATSSFADVVAEDDELISAEDLEFFSTPESPMSPRQLKKRSPFRSSRPKCKAVIDSSGRNRCKEKNGRCVASKAACKKLTRGRGFYIRSLCRDQNPKTEEKGFCGCCIKRPKKISKFLGEQDLLVSFAAGSKLGGGGRISMAGFKEGDSSLVIDKLSLFVFPSSGGEAIGFAKVPSTKVIVTSSGDTYNIEANMVATSRAFDAIAGNEPEVFRHDSDEGKNSGDDGHFYSVPRPVEAVLKLTIKIREDSSQLSLTKSFLMNAFDEEDFSIPTSNFEVLSHLLELRPSDRQLKLGISSGEIKLGASFSSLEVQYGLTPSPNLLEVFLEKPKLVYWPPLLLQEEHQSLCVQPIRVRHRECAHPPFFGFLCFSYTYSYSGAGLDFGRPAADEQWGKVDITFDWQPWRTIYDNAGKYKEVTEAEMGDFKREAWDDPDCIEVFFAPKFDPSSTYGGGACWDSGTAGAQIVTSDEQVPCGVDETHLAHELGHALGLMHPGTGHAVYEDGSTGTLLCGSGWERDNPRRNSQENGDNIVNPLLSCYMDFMNLLDRPDCADSGDCKTCAEHIPADAC